MLTLWQPTRSLTAKCPMSESHPFKHGRDLRLSAVMHTPMCQGAHKLLVGCYLLLPGR